MGDKYRMDEFGNVEPCTFAEWVFAYSSPKRSRIVKQQWVNGCFVSTVFLSIDHRFTLVGPPILFETMIFTRRRGSYKKLDQFQVRYTNFAEASIGHECVYRAVRHKNLTGLSNFIMNGLGEY